MNIINVKVNFEKGTCETTGINLITGDYNSTKMIFNFDRDTGTKVFEMKSPSEQLVMVQEIQNNEIILYGLDENENIASIFNEEGYYIFEISLYENESKLTSAKGKIKVKPEQVIIDGEVVEAYLPIFDQLLSQVNTAITQTNNLNITGSKVDTTSTITITHKDGTTTTLSVLDGEKGDKGDKGDAGAIKTIPVPTLPTEDIDDTAIYLVPMPKIEVVELPTTGTPNTIYIVISTKKRYVYTSNQWVEISQDNNYLEYMYINNKWELLGGLSMELDLDNYYTKTETNTLLNNKVGFTDYALQGKPGVVQPSAYYGTQVVGNGVITGYPHTYEQYLNSVDSRCVMDKTTLENVITGKGLVSNTDYATNQTGGVFKTSNARYVKVNSNGLLYCDTATYTDFTSATNDMFISKGTLDNVLTNRIGAIDDVLDAINGEVQ